MQAVAADALEAPPTHVYEGQGQHNWVRLTNYFGDVQRVDPGPQAYVVETGPVDGIEGERYPVIPPHFHFVRQFQVVVDGDRPTIGKHDVGAVAFHYTDPSTPYGPIACGSRGITFFTLRARADLDAHWMPGSRDEMLSRAGRNVVRKLPEGPLENSGLDVVIEPHEDGLAGYRLVIVAGDSVEGPDVGGSSGQYYLVTRGSLQHDGHDLPRLSLLWVDAGEQAPTLTAGAEGCELLVLQFPADGATAERVLEGVT